MIVPKLGEKKIMEFKVCPFKIYRAYREIYGDFTSTSIGPMKNPGNKLKYGKKYQVTYPFRDHLLNGDIGSLHYDLNQISNAFSPGVFVFPLYDYMYDFYHVDQPLMWVIYTGPIMDPVGVGKHQFSNKS